MNKVVLKEKYILEYIKNMLYTYSYSIKNMQDDNYQYHHNTDYEYAPSIIKYGILSMEDINNMGIKSYTEEDLKLMDDTESHINGKDGISLSIVGLTDLYRDEIEYDPYKPSSVDFLIDENVKTFRNTIHYGNEFISERKISTDKIISADIRIMEYINNLEENDKESIINAVTKYNQIIEMAKEIVKSESNMQIREMSEGVNRKIDVGKMSEMPKLLIKNKD